MTDTATPTPKQQSTDPWRVAWKIATNKHILCILLVALGLSLALAAWLPQAPPRKTSLITYVTWQTKVSQRFGKLDTILQKLGLFQISKTVWLRILLGGLGLLSSVHLVEALDRLKRQHKPPPPPDDAPGLTLDQNIQDVLKSLRQRRLRLVSVSHQGQSDIELADRWPWGELAPVLIHLGGLLLLLALAITASGSWRSTVVRIAPGTTTPIGHDSNLAFQLDALSINGQNGQASIWRNDEQIKRGDLAIGRPLAAKGIGTYLVGSGAGLVVSGASTDGEPLKLIDNFSSQHSQQIALVFTNDESTQYLAAPDVSLYLRVIMPRPVTLGDPPHIQVYSQSSGELLLEKNKVGQTLEIDGVLFKFEPTAHAQIIFSHDPGAWWTQLGGLVLGIGLVLQSLWPARRLWLCPQADNTLALGNVAWLPGNQAKAE